MLTLSRFVIAIAAVLVSFCVNTIPASAAIPIQDQFKATKSCQAWQSFRKRSNPGNVTTIPDTVYSAVAKNREDATHYYLDIPDVKPNLRWVAADCGELISNNNSRNFPEATDDTSRDIASVLAITWQPAFCETRTRLPECRTQTANRFDARNFTLHGLWPEPQYCNVSDRIINLDRDGKWSNLPAIDLSANLKRQLRQKMPGFASSLHLHEWYKHGTCYSETPEEYYRESLALLDRVNNSQVRSLFVANIDKQVTARQIQDRFDREFSNNAGNKITVECKRDDVPTNRRMIVELKLNLQGKIESDTSLKTLFKKSPTVSRGCFSGEIDRVGLD